MHGPRRHDSNVRPPPSEGGALTTELRRGGVDGRIRTCMSRVRSPAPDPFGHVDVAPPTGFAPVTSGLTDRRSPLLSYGGSVRVLGLEPSLFRGKSPVPYQSGVTRRGSAVRTTRTDRSGSRAGERRPGNDASAVVKELVPGLVIRCRTPGRSRTSCLRVWRPRRRRDSSARCERAHDGLRAVRQELPRRCWSEKAALTSDDRDCRLDRPSRVDTRVRCRSTGGDPGALVRRSTCVS